MEKKHENHSAELEMPPSDGFKSNRLTADCCIFGSTSKTHWVCKTGSKECCKFRLHTQVHASSYTVQNVHVSAFEKNNTLLRNA